jgi:hypothetical protein
MESNKRAFFILAMLFLTAVTIFCAEKKFLKVEKRGTVLSRYEHIKWFDKMILLVEDFEGFTRSDSAILQREAFFSYGSVKISLDTSQVDANTVTASKTAIKAEWKGAEQFGGWGRGIGINIDLDTATDYLNFRVYVPKGNGNDEVIKVILQEDDVEDGKFKADQDDEWFCNVTIPAKDQWQTISVPLKSFSDGNNGGDGIMNITRRGGLHNIIFSFEQFEKYTANNKWYFDFIFFSNEKLDENAFENNLN